MKKLTIVIAEAGVNHNGDINIARKLIDAAVHAGADYVKFQSFKAEKLVSPLAKKADYQSKNLGVEDNTQLQMLKNLELTHEDHLELIDYCNNKGINFFSTAFDAEGVKYLDNLGVDLIKSPSGEINNYPYLRAIAKTGKPVILSTGMATLGEIETALDILNKYGCPNEKITVLHCNTEYPTPFEDVNLKAMNTIAQAFGVKVGYSDHTLGIEVPIAAVALGASVIEKHFTLDRNLPGPDHKASLEPHELKAMVNAIRNIEQAISGDGRKQPSTSEIKNIVIARKSLHLSKDIKAGESLTEENLIPLRPGNGISPFYWEEVLNKKAARDLPVYHQLRWNDLI